MCNHLHYDSKPIKKSGKGWKIFFSLNGKMLGRLCNFCGEHFPYEYKLEDGKKYVNWKQSDYDLKDSGFCFFLTKKEAERVNKLWQRNKGKNVIVKIEYFDGIGKHNERSFIGGKSIPIALCKRFKLDVSEKVKYSL